MLGVECVGNSKFIKEEFIILFEVFRGGNRWVDYWWISSCWLVKRVILESKNN